jgi:hypothetical protein
VSVRDREDALVARLQALAPHIDGEPDPDFRAATRARLVAMAAVRTPAPAPVSPLRRLLGGPSAPSHWRTRLTAGLAGAALTVTALATVVAVATDSHPGDALYGLKRGTEQTQLALAGDARGEILLDLAAIRLDEVRALVDEDATALPPAGAPADPGGATVLAAGADAELVLSTLETMDEQTTEGTAWLTQRAVTTEDAEPLNTLAAWAQEQSAELAALRPDVPAAADDAVLDSLALLTDIGTRAAELVPALDCAQGPATSGSDELGPVPSRCPPDQPAVGTPGSGAPGREEGPATGTTDGPVLTIPEVPTPIVPGDSDLPGTDGMPGGGTLPTPIPPGPPPVTGQTPPHPLPTLPTLPALPAPPAPPGLPGLPGTGAAPPSSGSPVPTTPLDINVCLPLLVTLDDC